LINVNDMGRKKKDNKLVRKAIPMNEPEYDKAMQLYPGKIPAMIRNFISQIIKPAN